MKIIILVLLWTLSTTANAQQTFNEVIVKDLQVTGKVEVSSTTLASKPCPQMSTAQRNAVVSPEEGDCVYNNSTDKLNMYDGSAWVEVSSGNAGIGDWITAKSYAVGDIVIESNKIYRCLVAHTSGTFATDLAALKWTETQVNASSVINTPSGNLAATNGQAAFNELQSDIDGRQSTLTNSAGLRAALSDETGTGLAVFGTSPNITTPTGIVKGDVGLGNVDNTSDLSKPVSTAQQAALDSKVDGAASSVDSELMLYSGVTGKVSKRATGTGVVKSTSGVFSVSNVNLSSEVTGVLPLANGGTNKNFTASSGAIPYFDADSMEQLSAGVAGQVLMGGATPSFSNEFARHAGSSRLKVCHFGFGGAAATLASPTECTTGTCVEVADFDNCAAFSPNARNTAGLYEDGTFANGTFANSSWVECKCNAYDTTAGNARACVFYLDTGGNSWVTNASGGMNLNLFTSTVAGAGNDAYVQGYCIGVAP